MADVSQECFFIVPYVVCEVTVMIRNGATWHKYSYNKLQQTSVISRMTQVAFRLFNAHFVGTIRTLSLPRAISNNRSDFLNDFGYFTSTGIQRDGS
jgi:hypothetical protein